MACISVGDAQDDTNDLLDVGRRWHLTFLECSRLGGGTRLCSSRSEGPWEWGEVTAGATTRRQVLYRGFSQNADWKLVLKVRATCKTTKLRVRSNREKHFAAAALIMVPHLETRLSLVHYFTVILRCLGSSRATNLPGMMLLSIPAATLQVVCRRHSHSPPDSLRCDTSVYDGGAK